MHAEVGPRRRRRTIRILATCVAAIALLGCAAEDRPSVGEWTERWEAARGLVPTDRDLADGGSEYCDELTQRVRTELDGLTPAPSESIDQTVRDWRDRLRTLAFECPTDPVVVADALATIHTLEAEIAAASR